MADALQALDVFLFIFVAQTADRCCSGNFFLRKIAVFIRIKLSGDVGAESLVRETICNGKPFWLWLRLPRADAQIFACMVVCAIRVGHFGSISHRVSRHDMGVGIV